MLPVRITSYQVVLALEQFSFALNREFKQDEKIFKNTKDLLNNYVDKNLKKENFRGFDNILKYDFYEQFFIKDNFWNKFKEAFSTDREYIKNNLTVEKANKINTKLKRHVFDKVFYMLDDLTKIPQRAFEFITFEKLQLHKRNIYNYATDRINNSSIKKDFVRAIDQYKRLLGDYLYATEIKTGNSFLKTILQQNEYTRAKLYEWTMSENRDIFKFANANDFKELGKEYDVWKIKQDRVLSEYLEKIEKINAKIDETKNKFPDLVKQEPELFRKFEPGDESGKWFKKSNEMYNPKGWNEFDRLRYQAVDEITDLIFEATRFARDNGITEEKIKFIKEKVFDKVDKLIEKLILEKPQLLNMIFNVLGDVEKIAKTKVEIYRKDIAKVFFEHDVVNQDMIQKLELLSKNIQSSINSSRLKPSQKADQLAELVKLTGKVLYREIKTAYNNAQYSVLESLLESLDTVSKNPEFKGMVNNVKDVLSKMKNLPRDQFLIEAKKAIQLDFDIQEMHLRGGVVRVQKNISLFLKEVISRLGNGMYSEFKNINIHDTASKKLDKLLNILISGLEIPSSALKKASKKIPQVYSSAKQRGKELTGLVKDGIEFGKEYIQDLHGEKIKEISKKTGADKVIDYLNKPTKVTDFKGRSTSPTFDAVPTKITTEGALLKRVMYNDIVAFEAIKTLYLGMPQHIRESIIKKLGYRDENSSYYKSGFGSNPFLEDTEAAGYASDDTKEARAKTFENIFAPGLHVIGGILESIPVISWIFHAIDTFEYWMTDKFNILYNFKKSQEKRVLQKEEYIAKREEILQEMNKMKEQINASTVLIASPDVKQEEKIKYQEKVDSLEKKIFEIERLIESIDEGLNSSKFNEYQKSALEQKRENIIENFEKMYPELKNISESEFQDEEKVKRLVGGYLTSQEKDILNRHYDFIFNVDSQSPYLRKELTEEEKNMIPELERKKKIADSLEEYLKTKNLFKETNYYNYKSRKRDDHYYNEFKTSYDSTWKNKDEYIAIKKKIDLNENLTQKEKERLEVLNKELEERNKNVFQKKEEQFSYNPDEFALEDYKQYLQDKNEAYPLLEKQEKIKLAKNKWRWQRSEEDEKLIDVRMTDEEIKKINEFKNKWEYYDSQYGQDLQVIKSEKELEEQRRKSYNYEDSNEPVFFSGTQQPTEKQQPTIAQNNQDREKQQPTGGILSSYEVNNREAEKSYARLRDLRNKRQLNEFQRQELEQLEKEWEHMDQEFFEEKYRKSSSRLSFDKKTALYVAGALGLSSVFYGGYRWYKNKKQKQQERLARLKKRKQNNASAKTQ